MSKKRFDCDGDIVEDKLAKEERLLCLSFRRGEDHHHWSNYSPELRKSSSIDRPLECLAVEATNSLD